VQRPMCECEVEVDRRRVGSVGQREFEIPNRCLNVSLRSVEHPAVQGRRCGQLPGGSYPSLIRRSSWAPPCGLPRGMDPASRPVD
jgi:hypothetical protein